MKSPFAAFIRYGALAICASLLGTAAALIAPAAQSVAQDQPYVIEYSYKTKWGHADEFLALFKKNHYPVLRKEMELGRILKVSVVAPQLHASEDARWDYRVVIVFKNAATANDNFDSGPISKKLFPDQDTFKREEQRRFEILESHTDVPIKEVDLDTH